MILIYVNYQGLLIYNSYNQCSEIVWIKEGGDILYWEQKLIWQ